MQTHHELAMLYSRSALAQIRDAALDHARYTYESEDNDTRDASRIFQDVHAAMIALIGLIDEAHAYLDRSTEELLAK